MKSLPSQLQHIQKGMVTDALIVPAMTPSFASFAAMPPVFATAYMVAFMEWACIEALAPFLEDGERTVGTLVDMTHVAATPSGMAIEAHVTLLSATGRKLRFEVECRDEAGLIGKGFHERALINVESFLARLEARVRTH
jgi:fluoroacetyl-CoA thioesterase